MPHAPVFDALVVNDKECEHTQQKGDAIICRRRPKTQQTAQVAEKDKEKNRSDIIHEFSCISPQDAAAMFVNMS